MVEIFLKSPNCRRLLWTAPQSFNCEPSPRRWNAISWEHIRGQLLHIPSEQETITLKNKFYVKSVKIMSSKQCSFSGLRQFQKSFVIILKTHSLRANSLVLNTVNSRLKKDFNLQIHLHKDFFSDNRFLDSVLGYINLS